MKKMFFAIFLGVINLASVYAQGWIYNCGFEDIHENARWHVLSLHTTKWYIGNGTNNGGTKSLYISSDNGLSNSGGTDTCIALAYKEIYLDSGNVQISFDTKINNGSSIRYSGLRVFLIPSRMQFELSALPNIQTNGDIGSVFLPSGSISLFGTLTGSGVWKTYSRTTVDNPVSQWYKLCFYWIDVAPGGTWLCHNPQPAAIDNLVVSGPSRSSPQVTLTVNANGNYAINTITGGGAYNYMDTAEVNVSTVGHYHITGWSNPLLPFYISPTKDSLAILMDGSYSLTCNVAKDTHIVSVTSRGGPVPYVTNGGLIPWMESCTVTANTNNSYWRFLAWGNGETANPYSFTVTNDTNITAIYLAPNESAHRLQVLCSNPEYGVIGISGATQIYGEYYQDGMITLTATANYGYHFVQWSDGVTTNPRTINMNHDTYLTAIFAVNQYSLSVLTNDATMGTVVGEGSFNYLSQVTIMAIPSAHCHFVQWADGNTSNPRLVTVTQNMYYTAIFARDPQYTITISVNNPSRGSAEGGGIFFAGEYATLTATPNEHYYFSSWSNGVNANPYYLTVIENSNYTAIFEPINYTISLTCNDDYMGGVYGGGAYPYGSIANIDAQPFDGFRFIKWSDGNTHASRSLLVEGNISLQAHFGDAHTEGICDVAGHPIMVVIGRQIVVSGVEGHTITVYDVIGRNVAAIEKSVDRQCVYVPAPGVYVVRIDGYKPQKCVVR